MVLALCVNAGAVSVKAVLYFISVLALYVNVRAYFVIVYAYFVNVLMLRVNVNAYFVNVRAIYELVWGVWFNVYGVIVYGVRFNNIRMFEF